MNDRHAGEPLDAQASRPVIRSDVGQRIRGLIADFNSFCISQRFSALSWGHSSTVYALTLYEVIFARRYAA
jgi:hypothetical protein